jgi:hypothetical protein
MFPDSGSLPMKLFTRPQRPSKDLRISQGMVQRYIGVDGEIPIIIQHHR